MNKNTRISIALVDDHTLFRKGMIRLIEYAGINASIVFEADNGEQMKTLLTEGDEPDLILMDVNMPGMNGFACMEWLNENFPLIKVLAISMIDKEDTIVKMLKLGVKGYLNKDVEPKELNEAIIAIMNKGYYYTDFITGKLIHSIRISNQQDDYRKSDAVLTEKELTFLKLVCTEMTYAEIASEMIMSPKTIDGYRNSLFEKLQVKNRVGLVLYAVKNDLVSF